MEQLWECFLCAVLCSRVSSEWFEYSNDLFPQRIFAHSNDKLELIQMTHIEAKSVNKWLRYHLKQVKAVLKTAIIIVNRLKQLQGCCFSQYLSHFLMDFASLYLILKLIIGQIWHNRSFEYIRIFECPSEWMRYIRMFEYCSFTGNPIHILYSESHPICTLCHYV